VNDISDDITSLKEEIQILTNQGINRNVNVSDPVADLGAGGLGGAAGLIPAVGPIAGLTSTATGMITANYQIGTALDEYVDAQEEGEVPLTQKQIRLEKLQQKEADALTELNQAVAKEKSATTDFIAEAAMVSLRQIAHSQAMDKEKTLLNAYNACLDAP
jgi:hypothetical protein